jgi:hypothetical protein
MFGSKLASICPRNNSRRKNYQYGGIPIEGATILLLKSGKGTVSKSDGSFSLKVTQKQTEHVKISSVGYETVENALDWRSLQNPSVLKTFGKEP